MTLRLVEPNRECPEREHLENVLRDAKSAIEHHQKKIKPLNTLKYSELKQIEFEAKPLARELSNAKRSLTEHFRGCRLCRG